MYRTLYQRCPRPVFGNVAFPFRPSSLNQKAQFHISTRCHARHHKKSSNPLISYLQSLKWVPIPLSVGFAYIGYQQYGHIVKREEKSLQLDASSEDNTGSEWLVNLYRCLPLKIVSRLWGHMNDLVLPMWLREPVLKLYIWAFDCNLEEAVIRDLKHYRNLGEFFRRRIRPVVRPTDKGCSVVSPIILVDSRFVKYCTNTPK